MSSRPQFEATLSPYWASAGCRLYVRVCFFQNRLLRLALLVILSDWWPASGYRQLGLPGIAQTQSSGCTRVLRRTTSQDVCAFMVAHPETFWLEIATLLGGSCSHNFPRRDGDLTAPLPAAAALEAGRLVNSKVSPQQSCNKSKRPHTAPK